MGKKNICKDVRHHHRNVTECQQKKIKTIMLAHMDGVIERLKIIFWVKGTNKNFFFLQKDLCIYMQGSYRGKKKKQKSVYWVYSPNGCKGQGWVKKNQKQELYLYSHIGFRAPCIWAVFRGLPTLARRWMGLTDTSIEGPGLTCCVTMHAKELIS